MNKIIIAISLLVSGAPMSMLYSMESKVKTEDVDSSVLQEYIKEIEVHSAVSPEDVLYKNNNWRTLARKYAVEDRRQLVTLTLLKHNHTPQAFRLFSPMEDLKEDELSRCWSYLRGKLLYGQLHYENSKELKDQEEIMRIKKCMINEFRSALRLGLDAKRPGYQAKKVMIEDVLQISKKVVEDIFQIINGLKSDRASFFWTPADLQLFAHFSYDIGEKDLALQFLELESGNASAFADLEKMSKLNDKEEVRRIRNGVCGHLLGKRLYAEFLTSGEKTLEEGTAMALRDALVIKIGKNDPEKKIKKAIVQDSLQMLGNLKSKHENLFSGWSLMTYHMKIKKWQKACDLLYGSLLWSDYGGFSYNHEDREYMFTDPNYEAFMSINAKDIPDNYYRALFLYGSSQAKMTQLYHTNKITVKSLEETLHLANEAAALMISSVIFNPDEVLNPTLYVSTKWWKAILERQLHYTKLYDWLVKHHDEKEYNKERCKECRKKIVQHLDKFPHLDTGAMRTFISQVLEPDHSRIEEYDETERSFALKRIFAFKQFVGKNSSAQEKEGAIEELKRLADTKNEDKMLEAHASNLMGILCARYTSEKKDYEQMAISSFLRAHLAFTLEKKKEERPAVLHEKAFYLLGNPFIHSELAQGYALLGSLDKVNEHTNDLFETFKFGKSTGSFLKKELEKLFRAWSKGIDLQNEQGKNFTLQFMESLDQKVAPYGIEVKTIEGYKEIMNKLEKIKA